MNIQGLRAAEARLRKVESMPGNASLVRCATFYFEHSADECDDACDAWLAKTADAGCKHRYVAFIPRRGSSDRSTVEALPEPVESEGGFLARRGLMRLPQ